MAGFVGMNSVGTETVDKVVVYEKTVSDINELEPVFPSSLNDKFIIRFLPSVYLVNVSKPFKDIILVKGS